MLSTGISAQNTTRVSSRNADKFVVRLPEGMRESIQKAADEKYTSMNTFVVQAIAEKLERKQRLEALLDALTDQAGAKKTELAH